MTAYRMAAMRAWVALGLAAALPSVANAQSEQLHSYGGPYAPLADMADAADITFVEFPQTGNSFVAGEPIGFAFDYLGQAVVEFGVSPNGWIGFVPGTLDQSNNTAFGGVGTPNGFIAPWWDDLQLASRAFSASHALIGTAPHRARVIEVNNFSASPNLNDGGQWQIWLFETGSGIPGRFDIRVAGDLSNTYSASIGYEGITGLPSIAIDACSPACTASDFNTRLVNRVFTVLDVVGPELTGEIIDAPSGILAGQSGQIDVAVRNLGRTTASNVNSKLYLSADRRRDAGDFLIGQFTSATIAPNNGQATASVTVNVPGNTGSASFYLILEVDEPAVVPQRFQLDDVIFGASKIATGYDLLPTDVDPQTGANPNDPFSTQVEITQLGAPYTGNVRVAVYASADRTFDASDRVVGGPTQINLSGTAVERFAINGVVPSDLPPGEYYALAVVDDDNTISELNEFNNVATSRGRFSAGPDFQVGMVTVPVAAPPGSSASITTNIVSVGVPFSGSVDYQLYASSDTTVDLGTDRDLGPFSVTLAGETSRDDTRSVLIPGNIAPGAYHIIAVIDPATLIAETIESNNVTASVSRLLTHTDLRVSNVLVSGAARPGEMVSVSAEIFTAGPPAPQAVDYRVHLSANTQLDANDIRIDDGQVTLSGGTASLNINVPLPTNTLVRQWRVLVEVDPRNVVTEADETNNVARSLGTLSVQGADLVIAPPLVGAAFAFIGRDYRLRGDIDNAGVAAANGFRFAVFLSDNPVIGSADLRLYVSDPISIPAGGRHSFDVMIPIPTIPAATGQFLGVIADIFSDVPEVSELNNALKLDDRIDIVSPSPDLVGTIVSTASIAAAGERLFATRLLRNIGVEDSSSFEYTYYLSADDSITTDDIAIGTLQSNLRTGEESFRTDTLLIPSTVDGGTYRLGLIIDPAGAITESDTTNNIVVGPRMRVFEAPIRFVNAALPDGTIGVEYEVGLFAEGSPLPLSLSISAGSTPNALMLDPSTGLITGTPDTEGTSTFTVRATAQGNAYVEQVFMLRVAPPTLPLQIATTSMPAVLARRDYRAQLVARGGVGEQTWTVTSSIPLGLMFSDAGVLHGEALVTGEYPFEVSVTDANGATDSASLTLFVLTTRQVISLRTTDLPNGVVDIPYCEEGQVRLRAERGVPPYQFSIAGDGIDGMTLTEDGIFCGTPTRPGSYALDVRVADRSGLFDSSLMFVTIEDGVSFAFATFVLPDAVVDEPYSTPLTAIRGEAPYVFALDAGDLPSGMTLTEGGVISGTTTSTGTYSFIASVVDARGRSKRQPLSIRVVFDDTKGGTCGCATVQARERDVPWWALIVLVGASLSRRRRSSRGENAT